MENEKKEIILIKNPTVNSGSKYEFEFEQYLWNNKKCSSEMAKRAWQKIENERKFIEKDLQMLEAIQKEKSKQESIMISLLKTKEDLENLLNSMENAQ